MTRAEKRALAHLKLKLALQSDELKQERERLAAVLSIIEAQAEKARNSRLPANRRGHGADGRFLNKAAPNLT